MNPIGAVRISLLQLYRAFIVKMNYTNNAVAKDIKGTQRTSMFRVCHKPKFTGSKPRATTGIRLNEIGFLLTILIFVYYLTLYL